jgi:hypothetical protein
MTIQNTGVTITTNAFGHNDIVDTFTGPDIVSPLFLRSAVVICEG